MKDIKIKNELMNFWEAEFFIFSYSSGSPLISMTAQSRTFWVRVSIRSTVDPRKLSPKICLSAMVQGWTAKPALSVKICNSRSESLISECLSLKQSFAGDLRILMSTSELERRPSIMARTMRFWPGAWAILTPPRIPL